MLMRALATGVLFVMASSAYAGDQPRDLTLDNLKAKCKEFIANPQMQPQSVKISCNEISQFWQEAQPTQGLLKNFKKIGAEVRLKDIYQVPHQFFTIPQEDSPVACPQYVKMERVVDKVQVTVSCNEILEINDLAAYCGPVVDEAVAADPSLATVSPTSETLGFCPSL
jgi:hypothetical protein